MARNADSPDFEPVVIVFKPKERRENPVRDKLDVVRSVMAGPRAADLRFYEGARQPLGRFAMAGTQAFSGIDVNDYETPIVCVSVTAGERQRLAQHPDVDLVEDDTEFRYAHAGRRQGPRVQGLPSLEEEEIIPAGVAAISAPDAWGNSMGQGIRVAILDTGIDDSHADLEANVVGGAGFVPGTPGDRDDEGHGTFCAGIVGARLTGAGVVGVAPQASLFAVKVSDQRAQPSLRTVIAGLDWCIANHMHIVNMSFGYEEPSVALYLMCRRAWKAGLLLVASVGNAGAAVSYPAGFDNVVGVGAIDSRNNHYRQSNRGRGVDLCAPGVDVVSTGLRGSYRMMSGTSAAAPHVAGAAAVVWGAHRFATHEEIWHLLAGTARRLGDEAEFGCGRVNVLAASASMFRAAPRAISGCAVRVGMDRRGRRTAVLDAPAASGR